MFRVLRNQAHSIRCFVELCFNKCNGLLSHTNTSNVDGCSFRQFCGNGLRQVFHRLGGCITHTNGSPGNSLRFRCCWCILQWMVTCCKCRLIELCSHLVYYALYLLVEVRRTILQWAPSTILSLGVRYIQCKACPIDLL